MKVRNLLRSFGNTRASSTLPSKPTGDISSVFPSLSGNITTRLPPRFTALKARLKAGHEDALQASWHELLATLRDDVRTLNPIGDRRIPEIEFRDVENVEKCTEFSKEFRKRGVAVIRGVVSEQEALEGKRLLSDYIEMNPGVRGRHLSVFTAAMIDFSHLTYLSSILSQRCQLYSALPRLLAPCLQVRYPVKFI